MGNDWKVLEAGHVRSLSGGQIETRRIVGAPTISLERELLLTRQGETTEGAIRVGPVAGAEHYELEIVGESERRTVIVPPFLAHASWIPIPSLGPGTYRVRVRAVDSYGVRSDARTTAPIRVVAFDVPQGAVVDGSTVWLPPGGRVQLVRPVGLEMTYGSTTRYFIDAPRDIGLAGGNDTVARIRVRGGDDEARLWLRRRPAVDLRVETRRADRESHTVEIEIVAFDSKGLVSTTSSLHKRVRIDGRPVAVTWRQRGAHQRAVVTIPPRGAPTQVEVRIEDAVGPLAETSVEIAPQS
jgi:hypothetical protein